MPQNKLAELMLNRPQQDPEAMKLLPKGKPEDDPAILKFLSGIMGLEEQIPGDAASAAGNAAGIIGPGKALAGAKALGGALGAVSMIPPAMARARGVAILRDIMRSGEFSEATIKALQGAQQRWPRLFGHITKVEPISKETLRRYPSAQGAATGDLSGTAEAMFQYPEITKNSGWLSKLEINPNNSMNQDELVGHELSHIADNLVMPHSQSKYDFANRLPEIAPGMGTYVTNSQEIRARLQGARNKAYGMGIPKDKFDVVDELKPDATIVPKLDNRISNIDMPLERPKFVDPKQRLYEIMQERMRMREAGNPMPRVPDPRKK